MSYSLVRPFVRGLKNESQRAFTLIELLAVIAIVAVLAAITLGVVKGVNERAAVGQAKAELASLAQSLEQYKNQYGDYPQTSSAAILLQSLIGKLGPKGDAITGKIFIEVSKFNISLDTKFTPPKSKDPFTDTTATLEDPWGRNYNYYYKNSASPSTWKSTSYVLYSSGPTVGATPNDMTEPASAKPTTAGVVNYSDPSNLDNIYANQN